MPLTSLLPSLVLVWPSNCGSGIFTLSMAVRPSRTSSPLRFSSFSLRNLFRLAYSLMLRVSAERKPMRWVPPSMVLMLLT